MHEIQVVGKSKQRTLRIEGSRQVGNSMWPSHPLSGGCNYDLAGKHAVGEDIRPPYCLLTADSIGIGVGEQRR
jgi:hypothetical protein